MADQPFSLTRREHLVQILPAFLVFALVGEAKAKAPAARGSVRSWVDEQDGIARALSGGEIRPIDWAREVERLAARVDVEELMAAVERAQPKPAGPPSHNDPAKRYVRFLDDQGTPRRLSYGAALFDFAPHNVITPHGHRHMVSAHMVVRGRLRVRNFDRLRDEGDAMVIRPTRDYVARLGEVSTMCSERDNIHWFVPQGGPATTFDIVISDLDPLMPSYDIKAIDPVGGRPLDDGSILARVMEFGEASRRYTAAV